MHRLRENYMSFMTAGLILTLVLVGIIAVYSWRESSRLAQAAAALTSEHVQRGAATYQGQCAACHGDQGQGGVGPALNNRTVLKNTLDNVFFSADHLLHIDFLHQPSFDLGFDEYHHTAR